MDCHHDFDGWLSEYWYGADGIPPRSPSGAHSRSDALDAARLVAFLTNELARCERPRRGDQASCEKDWRLITEELALRVGGGDVWAFRAWLRDSPGALRQYTDGDETTRAALVDLYLRVAR